MNAGAFGVLAMEELPDGKNLSVDDYTGYGKRRPFLAAMMAVFMFSLAGVPPFAGFFGKYYVFAGAVEAGYTWLAIVGVVMSVVSAFYYLRLVVTMYFRDGEQEAQGRPAFGGVLAIAVAAFALLGLGVLPSAVVSVTRWFF
jgi:NADH-quinone oxidoreductase subunit N